jgi:polysaccharide biosynthesis protein PslG
MRSTVPVSLLAAPLLAIGLAGCSGSSSPEPSHPKTSSTSASPTASTPPAPGTIDSQFFGVHDGDPIAQWPAPSVGSLRVWDAGAAWRQIETSPGVFNFGRLDAIVKTARAHKADVLIVLGQTPAFHATAPSPDAAYGAGASSMPKLAAWRTYVDKVVRRYHAPDVQFQVWNEANVVNYWSGTKAQMAKLTGVARQVVDKVDPDITLVAPAFVTRLASQQRWMNDFFAQKVGGTPVGDLIDVVSLQLYPVPTTPTPEASMAQLAADRKILAARGVDKPVWDTEINYGAKGGRKVPPAPTKEQAANVARTYLLNAAHGVQRVFWYVWDLSQPILDTYLVEPGTNTLTAGGRALGTVRKWMVGTIVKGCAVDKRGTYTCTLVKDGATRLVMWNPQHSVQVKVPAGAATAEKLIGTAQSVTAGASLKVDYMPVLLKVDGSVQSASPSASTG